MTLKHFTINKPFSLPEEIRNLPLDEYRKAIARFRIATVEVAVTKPDDKLLLLKRKQMISEQIFEKVKKVFEKYRLQM